MWLKVHVCVMIAVLWNAWRPVEGYLDNLNKNRLDPLIRKTIELAKKKYGSFLDADFVKSGKFPFRAHPNSTKWDEITDGSKASAGYYPGNLWHLYRLTLNRKWAEYAARSQNGLVLNNDCREGIGGFYISFGQGLKSGIGEEKRLNWWKKLSENVDKYIQTCYSKSYHQFYRAKPEGFDCSSNPISVRLFEGSTLSNDALYRKYAAEHVNRSLNCVNEDESHGHLIIFNEKGEVVDRESAFTWKPGAIKPSTLSNIILRFVQFFDIIGDDRFLTAAKKAADCYIRVLPSDKLPLWEISSVNGDRKDAGKAACGAVGLLFLYFETGEQKYLTISEDIIEAVIKNCSAENLPLPAIIVNDPYYVGESTHSMANVLGDNCLLWYLEEYRSLQPVKGKGGQG